CSIWPIPVRTITASITPSMAAITRNQRRSVLTITGSEIRPAAPSLLNWLANVPPAHEQHKIEEQPTCEEQPHRAGRNNQGSTGTIFESFMGCSASGAGCYALWFAR